jgi:hypothetical protein
MTYDDAARKIIEDAFPGAQILGTGDGIMGDTEGISWTGTFTMDFGGQGTDVRVYDLWFYSDGGGEYTCVASSGQSHLAVPAGNDFTYNLVGGEVVLP